MRPASRARAVNLEMARLDLVIEVLRRGNGQTIIARGGSMQAAIRNGATLTLAPLARPPRLGEVVAVTNARVSLMVHRVVGIDAAGRVLTKGDACPSPDGWFAPQEVVGLVVSVDGGPVRGPTPTPPRWRRALRRLWSLAR